jgi:TPP-dependent pyruvate/acetoin dehydrogenase alpha subunit
MPREQLVAFVSHHQPIRDLTQRASAFGMDVLQVRALREMRDPITNLRERLVLADEEWARLDAEAHRVVDASVEFAKAGTDPRPEDALENVYAEQP